MNQTTHNGLSNEVLIAIFHFVGGEELPTIFATSKLFNQLALVTLYNLHNVAPPFEHLHVNRQFLRSLRLALNIPPFSKVSYTSCYETLSWDIENLRTFLLCYPRIPEVELDFGQDILSSDLSYTEKEESSKSIQALLLTITENDGPVVRITSSGIYMSTPMDALRPEINRSSQKIPPRTAEEASADRGGEVLAMVLFIFVMVFRPQTFIGWIAFFTLIVYLPYQHYSRYRGRLRPSVSTVTTHNGSMKVPSLKTLRNIRITSVSAPPFNGHWTLMAFDLQSIHSFYIGKPMDLSLEEWGAILPWVHLPSLIRITVCNSEITLEALFLFLSRHPLVIEMSYTSSTIHSPPQIVPLDIASNLVFLSASPEFIDYIHSIPGILPSLKKIRFELSRGRTSYAKQTTSALRRMASRESDIHLEITIPPTKWFDDKFDVADADYSLPCVKTLSLYWFPVETVPSIPRWLLQFPALNRLGLMDLELPREEKHLFIQGLRASCPDLRILVIGSAELSVDEWLSKFTTA